MEIKLQQAVMADYDSVLSFYDDVMERTPDITLHAHWQKGKHPTAEGLKALIEDGDLYLCKENETIVGALALPMYQEGDYHAVAWSRQAADDEVAVIHVLAVSPDRQGSGIGSGIVREAISLARQKGMKSIRLDIVDSNTPARRVYEGLGFVYRGTQHLYAENSGWLDFCFFEYDLVTPGTFVPVPS